MRMFSRYCEHLDMCNFCVKQARNFSIQCGLVYVAEPGLVYPDLFTILIWLLLHLFDYLNGSDRKL